MYLCVFLYFRKIIVTVIQHCLRIYSARPAQERGTESLVDCEMI